MKKSINQSSFDILTLFASAAVLCISWLVVHNHLFQLVILLFLSELSPVLGWSCTLTESNLLLHCPLGPGTMSVCTSGLLSKHCTSV